MRFSLLIKQERDCTKKNYWHKPFFYNLCKIIVYCKLTLFATAPNGLMDLNCMAVFDANSFFFIEIIHTIHTF
jgi:hypothetical protein